MLCQLNLEEVNAPKILGAFGICIGGKVETDKAQLLLELIQRVVK